MLPTDERLAFIQPISWLVSSPYLSALFIFLVTPGGVWIARLISGRVLLPSDEFSSFRANKFFAPLLACNVGLLNSRGNDIYIDSSPIWTAAQVLLIVLWVGIGLWHRSTETPYMNAGKRYSITSLYHDGAVYVLAGPVVTLTTLIGFPAGAWSFPYVVMRIVGGYCIYKYLMGVLDHIRRPRETFDGMTLLDVAHTDHSYPWQWAKRPGHVSWWWNRYRNSIVHESWLAHWLHNMWIERVRTSD